MKKYKLEKLYYQIYFFIIALRWLRQGFKFKILKRIWINFKRIDTNKKYGILGYGSLLNKRSAKRTLGNTKSIPVIVNGFERIYELNTRAQGGSALNVVLCNKKINCLCYFISWRQMFPLVVREGKYCLNFIEKKDIKSFYKNNILPENVEYFLVYVKDKEHLGEKEPKISYLQANVFGCNSIGKEFLNMYLNTTKVYNKNKELILLKEYIDKKDIERYIKEDSNY